MTRTEGRSVSPNIELDNARLALETIQQKATRGIPSWLLHIMQHSCLERLAGAGPGD